SIRWLCGNLDWLRPLRDGRVLSGVGVCDRAVRQHVQRESRVYGSGDVRIDEGHGLAVGQVGHLLLLDISTVERLMAELLAAVRALGTHLDALMVMLVFSLHRFVWHSMTPFAPGRGCKRCATRCTGYTGGMFT